MTHDTRCQDLPCGITTIDTGYERPRFAASHLIVEGDQAAFVDVGTTHSASLLLEALRRKGVPRENVAYVMVTHVHLDHAGGAGELLRHLPHARLVVHPRGARHMIDPGKLVAGSAAVYGEAQMLARYGEIVPVPAERVIEAGDGFTLDLNGRQLLLLDTPGHARHHYCVVDEASRGIFTGDTFGISYREFDVEGRSFIFPTTTPVQFDPPALHASIDRLMSHKPERIYLTHYGCVTDTERLAHDLHEQIDMYVAVARDAAGAGEARHQRIKEGLAEIMLARLARHGCTMAREQILGLLAMDFELNAQGIGVWLDNGAGQAR